jgi:hypothetical protein
MRRTQSAFGFGVGSAYFDMWNAPLGTNQDLITKTFQPSIAGDSIRFEIAYCAFGTINDQLAIYGSTNGGTSYTLIHLLPYTEMITTSTCVHPFTPAAADWGKRAYPLATGTNRIKFTGMSAFGDGVFLDSIGLRLCYFIDGTSNKGNGIPNEFGISQNYPNPFNPKTIINYALPKAGKVVMKVYDILGKEVVSLVDGFKQAGNYSVEFDATDLPSGVYFYTLRAENFAQSKKMLLIK